MRCSAIGGAGLRKMAMSAGGLRSANRDATVAHWQRHGVPGIKDDLVCHRSDPTELASVADASALERRRSAFDGGEEHGQRETIVVANETNDFNQRIIEEFRASGGKVGGG